MTLDELLTKLAHDYKNPEDGDADRNGNTRLAVLQAQYNLSSLKVQKLLVTAGVYEPVKTTSSYYQIKRLYDEGKSAAEIMEATGLSSAVVNASIPYERGVQELDKLGVKITNDANRKRRQKSNEKMRKENARAILSTNITDEAFWNALIEHQGDVFVTSSLERYSYQIDGDRIKVDETEFDKSEVLAILHNGLELMAKDADGPIVLSDYIFEKDFDQTPALPYIYPVLVVFHIVDGEPKDYITRRLDPETSCSCCGRRTSILYPIHGYKDLVNIAEEEEHQERKSWTPEKRQQVAMLEAMVGRKVNHWEERRNRENPAILAYNEMLQEDGDQHLCSLCATTIRMALEEGENPRTDGETDYASLPRKTLHKLFMESLEDTPSCQFTESHQYIISPADFGSDVGDGGQYLYQAIDARGERHLFLLSLWLREHADGDQGLSFTATEIHKLTKAGRIASDNTITDYEIRHFRMLYKDEDKEKWILVGFLELEEKIKHRLQNLTLTIDDSGGGNGIVKGEHCYFIGSIGQFECVSMNGMYMSVDDDWDGGDYGYMVDGMVFTGNELALMMSCYEGSPVVFQEGVEDFKSGEYMMPVQLTQKELVNETIELINMFSTDGRFERERDKENFEKLFGKTVLAKMKLYHESRPRGYGRLAGMEVIKRLKWIEGTEREQDMVRKIIR